VNKFNDCDSVSERDVVGGCVAVGIIESVSDSDSVASLLQDSVASWVGDRVSARVRVTVGSFDVETLAVVVGVIGGDTVGDADSDGDSDIV
jgi:hypothetical protein